MMRRICIINGILSSIDGCTNATDIANTFATNFDKGIREIKLGKAPGCDGIEAEHLRYAHPSICVMLSLLFDAMIIRCMVPSLFGLGITVHLTKGHNLS